MFEQYNIPKQLRRPLSEIMQIEGNEKRWLAMKSFFYLHLPEYIDNRMAWKLYLESKNGEKNGK